MKIGMKINKKQKLREIEKGKRSDVKRKKAKEQSQENGI